jgi:hypothetical protein
VLVTTRLPNVLPAGSYRVLVDQMTHAQSRQMITAGGVGPPPALVDDLVRVSGAWPLLAKSAADQYVYRP